MSRVEDPPLVTGHGKFVADVHLPGELHVAFLRSPYPHARILSIRTEAARAQPGVVAVFCAADIEGAGQMPSMHVPHPEFARSIELVINEAPAPLLAANTIRYVGEPVAMVVAESRPLAEDAVDLLELEVEPLPAVVDFDQALDGVWLYEQFPNNLAASLHLRREMPGQAAASPGGVTVKTRLRIGRHGGAPLETRGVVADPHPAKGKLTLWTSTQVPHRVRLAVAETLGWPEDGVRVITPDVGGGFGTKANTYAEEVLVPYCAARLGRPVRWIEDRSEHFLAAAQARDQVHDIELAVAADGTIRSFKDDYIVNLGAYSLWTAGIICNTALHALGPYHMPLADITGRAIFSNKPPAAQFRGAGRPEACFALERALDMAAYQLGIDPIEIRRRNLIQPDEMPYAQHVLQRDGMPILYDASDYPAILDRALALSDPESWPELRRTVEQHGQRLGIGCATYVEATGRGPFEGARVWVNRDGSVDIFTGAASTGQGHRTTLAKVAARVLGIPLEAISVVGGDTELMPRGVGTFASRTAVVAGNAVHQASLDVRDKLLATAADLSRLAPSDIEWTDGGATGPHGFRMSLADIAGHAAEPAQPDGDGHAEPGPVVQAQCYFQPDTVTWTMGVHVALVAVEPATGGVRILRYASVHDGGPSLDEQIVDGQMQGGIALGIGGALFEDFAFTPEGQPVSLNLADYLLPTSLETPDIRLGHVFAAGNNPLGIKGVGESGTVPAAAALGNAISNALDGAILNETPITPERIWRAMHE